MPGHGGHPTTRRPRPAPIGRRRFLAGTAGAAALLASQRVPGAWATPGAWPDDPFTPGVASGDPTPTGMVLWTRLVPRPLDPDGGMPARPVPVDWEVATGPRLRDVVARGRVAASPALGHAVHVEVDGLEPGRHYWYRFRAGGHLSRVGRTRTCADPRAPLGRSALAVVSCQNYEKGWYTAYRHLAEEDLDVVLHLGDYIYENPPRRGLPRRHAGGEPSDLAGYRARHAQYKTDRDLQAAHASHPFVTAWDDHEVENDHAGRHPVEGGDPAAFLRRRAAACRAYWEHLPLRRPPRGATMPLYRRLRFGDLVELNLLDTRQYRDDQPCDEGGRGGGRVVTCPERVDPRRTILGDHQRRWLLRGLDRSQARWNVLAQQVVMAPLDLHPGPGRSWWSDAWDGYVADRERILRFLWERQPANPVLLTGDIHAFLINDLQLPGQGAGAPVVATELVGTSISSGASKSSGFRRHLPGNPHVRFFESRLRGYTRCTVIRERWYADLRVVGHGRAAGGAGPHPRQLGCGEPRPGAEQV